MRALLHEISYILTSFNGACSYYVLVNAMIYDLQIVIY